MRIIGKYFVLFLYSCLSSMLMLFVLGVAISAVNYFKGGGLYFPLSQMKRAVVFGFIAGTAITLAAIVFNLIDKYNSGKTPPSDPD
ncbi:hypothetical protein CQ001_11525 [Erwinia billingiae]|nr:hypothetical protein CQ001_11525 [Erwinia billingiae]